MSILIRSGRLPDIKHRPHQFEQGETETLPAPYAGVNLRDDVTSLKQNEARVLENWISKSGNLGLRDGYSEHATGVGSATVGTLAAFSGLTAQKMIAAGGGAIYDVTTPGSAVSLATGLTVNRWQTTLYNNRLLMVNGTDAPRDYNGSVIASTAWSGSGLTITNLVNIAAVRNRIWLCENNSADVWYGSVGGITGATTKFQLSQVASGGICTAIGSWSRDAGDGADDATVFVMSTGEIIVYQGDPAATFTLVGKFAGAPPLGRQCLFKVGGELVVLTRLGILPVSAAIAGVALDLKRINPWGKIAPGIVRDASLHGSDDGWHGVLHDGIVYVDVPQVTGSYTKQRVLNTRTGSWSDFAGWPASALCSFGDTLYIGGWDGRIFEVGAEDDEGSPITARASGAFVVPSRTYRTNLFTAIRPKVQTSGGVSGLVGVDTDYVLRGRIGEPVLVSGDVTNTPWGSAWGSAWGAQTRAEPRWYSIDGEGRSVSVRFQVTAQSSDVQWFATDLTFKPGGIR